MAAVFVLLILMLLYLTQGFYPFLFFAFAFLLVVSLWLLALSGLGRLLVSLPIPFFWILDLLGRGYRRLSGIRGRSP